MIRIQYAIRLRLMDQFIEDELESNNDDISESS